MQEVRLDMFDFGFCLFSLPWGYDTKCMLCTRLRVAHMIIMICPNLPFPIGGSHGKFVENKSGGIQSEVGNEFHCCNLSTLLLA